jgi:DNA-binding transcriptional ArsR family regulator
MTGKMRLERLESAGGAVRRTWMVGETRKPRQVLRRVLFGAALLAAAALLLTGAAASSARDAAGSAAPASTTGTGLTACEVELGDDALSPDWAAARSAEVTDPDDLPAGAGADSRDILLVRSCRNATHLFFYVEVQGAVPSGGDQFRVFLEYDGDEKWDRFVWFGEAGTELWEPGGPAYWSCYDPLPACGREAPPVCNCWEVGVEAALLSPPASYRIAADTRDSKGDAADHAPDGLFAAPPPRFPLETVAVAAGVGTVAAAGSVGVALAVGGESVRHPLHLASFALFTRLGRKRVLDNFVRGQLFGRVQERPGITYGELLQASGIGNGNLAYHLRVLEREGFVRSERQGRFKLFYPTHAPMTGRGLIISSPQKRVLDAVAAAPGISTRMLASGLGMPPRIITYHARGLAMLGLLRTEGWGAERRHFPGDLSLLEPQPRTRERDLEHPEERPLGG